MENDFNNSTEDIKKIAKMLDEDVAGPSAGNKELAQSILDAIEGKRSIDLPGLYDELVSMGPNYNDLAQSVLDAMQGRRSIDLPGLYNALI
jgi:hypothetical protein